ncbi:MULTISPECIES: PotD/PotF family extracellular solute-binding protein [unclassified Fusibacter]|uniref:ABC transporter substrate-binding protein n=1 Tax=unclassified Fusibacter TaxID=2624464 RepID=UPI00101080FE|nr:MULTISPECIES: ABC transporter substrate-binding protein [unclassified Fusibacter]MCK8061188.1 ABC transporter substrate-binding protein [Fusibacter sp. A2]NPE23275.1 ABC transporter substrate-binding protein [Fusibacter sp. A1]RXV59318.1 extracellular solute-binding protein [Fusibacter sp. A1]
MKRILSVLLVVVMMFALTACGSDKKVLYVYNWGEYMDESLREQFTEETGIQVIYEEYATNEDMYVKLKNGGTQYDIAIPSDYMIEKLISEDMLEKVDTSLIDNYGQIGDAYRNLAYDPGNEYSVPYFWGTVGILYNETLVDDPVDSWNILFDEKYKGQILMLDSQRDSLMIALKLLGYSMNTRNENELEEAKQLLMDQKDLVLAYVVDNGKDIMVADGAAFMATWNGEAIALQDENENLNFALPKEGTNVWYDAMVIPKGAQNYDEAIAFINFMLDPENAALNTDWVGYSTPNTGAFDLLDEEVQNNEIAYPNIDNLKNSEIFNDPGDFIEVYNRVWTEIKLK